LVRCWGIVITQGGKLPFVSRGWLREKEFYPACVSFTLNYWSSDRDDGGIETVGKLFPSPASTSLSIFQGLWWVGINFLPGEKFHPLAQLS